MPKPKGYAGDIPVYCAHDEIVPADKLMPNPRNPYQHPDAQIALLAKIIAGNGWRAPVTVSKRSGFIVRGHARLMAADVLGCPVPVDYQDYADEAAEHADLLADNRLAELAEFDRKIGADLLEDLDAGGIDTDLTGFDAGALEEMLTAAPPQQQPPEREKPTPYHVHVYEVVAMREYDLTGNSPKLAKETALRKAADVNDDDDAKSPDCQFIAVIPKGNDGGGE